MWQLFICSPLIRVGRSFVIKRCYSLVVIARTRLYSNLSLQPHTQGKNCWQSCFQQNFLCWKRFNAVTLSQVVFLLLFSVDRDINQGQGMFVFDLAEIGLFYLLLRKGHQLVLFTKREWCVCIFILRILSASSRILLMLKVFLPPCKQPLNFQKPTSYRFHE